MSQHVVIAVHSGSRALSWRSAHQRASTRSGSARMIVIPKGRAARWDMEGPVEVSHVYLPDCRLQACAIHLVGHRKVELIERGGFADATAHRIQEILTQEAARTEPSAQLFVEQAIELLCAQLVRAHSTVGTPASPGRRRGLSERQLKRVTLYVRDRLDGKIGLTELADLIGLSRNHFCTAFRLATGQTPYEWLTDERMQEARRRLAETSESVTEIALSVGFGTPSAFAAAFRKAFSITPSAYRRSV